MMCARRSPEGGTRVASVLASPSRGSVRWTLSGLPSHAAGLWTSRIEMQLFTEGAMYRARIRRAKSRRALHVVNMATAVHMEPFPASVLQVLIEDIQCTCTFSCQSRPANGQKRGGALCPIGRLALPCTYQVASPERAFRCTYITPLHHHYYTRTIWTFPRTRQDTHRAHLHPETHGHEYVSSPFSH